MKRFGIVLAFLGGLISAATAGPLWSSNFELGSPDGWKPRGNAEALTVVAPGREGGSSLLITKRTTTWQGPIHNLAPSLVGGASYRVTAWVRYPAGPATRTLNLSIELGYQDPNAAHQYKNLASVTVAQGEWAKVEATYTVPQDPTLNLAALYFETPYKSDSQVTPDDTIDFQIDDVAVEALEASQKPVAQEDIPRLRDVLAGQLLLGTALSPEQLDPTDPHYRLLVKHYGVIVAGNAMKPDALQPREGTFSFSQADKLVAYAERTGTRVRGHTLVWHNQTPSWFFTDPQDSSKPASKALLLERLKTHITTVVTHFRGSIDTWDVVNEVLSDNQGLRTGDEGSRWFAIAGQDYIDAAFRAAHAADPDARLAINDYNLESSPAKREALFQLVKGMKARGVPVNVVGLQGHISLYGPSIDDFRQAIRKFASLGVAVQVTELDVSIYSGSGEAQKEPTPELLNRQARRYADLFTMFREEAAAGRLDMVLVWGSADDDTWLDNFPVPGRLDAPLLFDRELKAKPAFWGVVDPASIPESKLPPSKQARALRGTPKVDGAVDDVWKKVPAITTAVATDGQDAAAGSFRMLWDDQNLYVLAEVKDPVLDDTSKNVYEQDSVEVFVDQNNHKTEGYEADDGQYRVNFKNLVSFNGNPQAQKGFRSAAKVITGGYLVELAIPFTALKPAAGGVLGFDVQVNDGRDGKRVGIRNFNDGSNSGWQSTLGYGTLVLEK